MWKCPKCGALSRMRISIISAESAEHDRDEYIQAQDTGTMREVINDAQTICI